MWMRCMQSERLCAARVQRVLPVVDGAYTQGED